MKKQATTNEILDAVNQFASYVQENMATKKDLADLRNELRGELASKQDLADLRTELRAELASKHDLQTAKLDMIDHVDRKVDQVRGELTAFVRKGHQPLAS